MSDYQIHKQSLRELEPDASAVAFFDLDRTLISTYSAVPLLLEEVKSRQVSVLGAYQQILMAIGQSQSYFEFDEVIGESIAMLKGISEEEFQQTGARLFEKHLQKKIYSEAQEFVDRHRDLGHRLVVVSSATRYQIEPVASAMGFDGILCSELEVTNGCFTGVTAGKPCWGEEKLNVASEWVVTNGGSLGNAWFYTDSIEDLPLLEAVGHPVATNPDKALAKKAEGENWTVCSFRSRAKPDLMDLSRTTAMFSIMGPSLVFGQALKWLGGMSPQDAALSTFTRYSEAAMELAGVKLDVKNEHYLWQHRPAIFLVNHQSILDGYAIPALVKRDYFIMGKQEARKLPVLGKMMEDAGFIMFDRHDHDAAIEACDEAAERIKNGQSLIIAPEGTRSYSTKLEPFKKGAFHIALQTGAPIVPIVIRNATELWPRDQMFCRSGTLRIEVLKPVSTKRWTENSLDKHLVALHERYLDVLEA